MTALRGWRQTAKDWAKGIWPWVAAVIVSLILGFMVGRYPTPIRSFIAEPATYGWAAAIGSTLAAAAAVIAAFVPTIIQRRRDFQIGAIEAAATGNTIGMAIVDLMAAETARKSAPDAEVVLHLQNCLGKINSIPVRSILNYSTDLAQHLLAAKNQLVVLQVAFKNDTVWRMGASSTQQNLDAYNGKLKKAVDLVQEMIEAENAAAARLTTPR